MCLFKTIKPAIITIINYFPNEHNEMLFHKIICINVIELHNESIFMWPNYIINNYFEKTTFFTLYA